MAVDTHYEHIIRDQNGVPTIAGTTIKVVEIVQDYLVYGWSAEEIFLQHKPYLTMGQVHSALGFYWDNQVEMDADIQRRYEFAEKMRLEAPPNPHVGRLRALKRADAG
jgi:uncharacterized protein (DUF433 family)